ncbi:ATP-binding protein [Ferrimonas balearica]|uniref:ATP-binding protein n=1 Tax=Ferrimonas balearica TaxID=44012 RepID=UPI001C99D739|nr:ATP-binding protein [Ferrimonas balearica]MBY5992734.1 ATP-binding protein [Ferrimonas balearica]
MPQGGDNIGLSLSIEDPGAGLSSPSSEGHGLGLLIVTELCRRYGWVFALEERPEGGCRASIDFTGTAASPEC